MLKRKWLAAAFGVALVGVAAAPSPRAYDNASKTMYLTFNRPVRLPGVALGTGTYIFELADPDNAWDVVRVSSRDRKTVYFQTFTRTVTRPSNRDSNRPISFAEGPADAPLPILVWWPLDESTGREFIYKDRK